eukprot:6469101-Amphidinium_carterae.1
MSAESEAAFSLLMASLDVPQSWRDRMGTLNLKTMSSLAFASSGPAGQISGQQFEESVLVRILGNASHSDAPVIRRLYVECYTTTLSEIRANNESKGLQQHYSLPENDIAQKLGTLSSDHRVEVKG